MRRITLLLTIAAITAVTLVTSADPVFADACFDEAAQAPGQPGIGPVVGGIASNLAGPPREPVPGSGVPTAQPSVLNQAKQALCPPQ
jgi:hypothetical protein